MKMREFVVSCAIAMLVLALFRAIIACMVGVASWVL